MFFYYFTEKEDIDFWSVVSSWMYAPVCSFLIFHKNNRKVICYKITKKSTKKTQKLKVGGKTLPYKDKEQRQQMENRKAEIPTLKEKQRNSIYTTENIKNSGACVIKYFWKCG